MIEFKAECGHTVRARDEDGGGVVRCSYCGKPANVPEGSADDLDFLFNEVEQDSSDSKRGKRRWRKLKGAATRKRAPGQFNPFAVVLRLCYAALLIIIVLVVGNQFVIPLFREGGVAKRVKPLDGGDGGTEDSPRIDGGSSNPRSGRRSKARLGVLLASSFPPGARIFCIKETDAPPEGRIHRDRNVTTCANEICKPKHGYGVYVVEVAIPVRHSQLRLFPEFNEFRRKLRETSKEKDRRRVAEQYFIPDGSVLLVDRDGGQLYIVRQYRQERLKDRATAVRALFLPRIPKASGRGYSIDALIKDAFIPKRNKYEFDVADVSDELKNFFKIEQLERDAIVEALRRIGVISYVTPDGRTTLFEIDVEDGILADKVLD